MKPNQSTKSTAVQWFFDRIKSHFVHDGDVYEDLCMTRSIAKMKEREQHSNTWNAAIQAHEERGHVYVRALTDFDNYEIGKPEVCDVCGSEDIIDAPHMGRNCNWCNPL